MKKLLIILILPAFLYSCKGHKGYKYPEGKFPETPVNITQINTEYNDYNSALPYIDGNYEFFFSSDRYPHISNYDIIRYEIYYYWNMEKGTFNLDLKYNDYNYEYDPMDEMLESVNSAHDEFGPYSFGYTNRDTLNADWYQFMMFSSDKDEDQDIYFLNTFLNYDGDNDFGTAQKIRFIDTTANEMYPSFYGEEFNIHQMSKSEIEDIRNMLFCSDKSGSFDIYSVDFTTGPDLYNSIAGTEMKTEVPLSINSEADDKCPYANTKLMVFTSDRPGGFGGFDLYYSIYLNGSWSAPVNFGENINSEYNEYRPITKSTYGFVNDLMIFSSDRPGGKGGYDLYYVGIDKMIE